MSGAAVAVAAVSIAVAVDAGTTLAIVAAVGATISAVGVVTHNQTLAIAGGVIGAVGAIGGLASAAGIFSAGDAAAGGSSLFDAGGLASDGGFAGAVGSDVAAGGGGALSAQAQALVDAGLNPGTQSAGIASSVAGGNVPDIINTVSGQVIGPDAALTSAPANAQTPDVTPPAAVDSNQMPSTIIRPDAPVTVSGEQTATLDSQAVPNATPTAPTVGSPAAPGAPTTTTNSILNGGQGVTGVPAPGTTVTGVPFTISPDVANFGAAASTNAGGVTPPTSAFGDVWNFVKGNQTLVAGSIQAGAALLGGATDSLKPAQIKALEAQANANQAAANLSANQLANMQGSIPTARRMPSGMINSPPVTGQAA